MVTPFRKLPSGNLALDRVQDSADDTFRSIQACVLLDGVLLKAVFLPAASFTPVEHRLTREPRGYLVVGRNANAVVYDDQANNTSLANRTLKLRASADVTVDLWVF